MLPESLLWPVDGQSGEAMSFLGQIDCNRLPDCPGEAPLPRDGLLYFFAGRDDGPAQSRVLFSPDGQASRSEARRPDNLMPCLGDRRRDYVPALAQDRVFPKWAVEPVICKTYPGEAVAEQFYYKASGRVDGDPFVYATACASAQYENLLGIFGSAVDWAWPQLPNTDLWWPDDAFPYAWMQLVACAEQLLRTAESGVAGVAKAWIERGHDAGLYEGVSGDTRHKFRAWVESLAKNSDIQTRGPTLPVINSSIFVAVEETCDLCLARSQEAAALIPDEIVTMQGYRHASFGTFRGYARNQLHQMLGHGKGVQSAPEIHKEDVLLMQFDTDAGMHWTWGDNGILQFWIRPEDLSARQFDRVVMTTDCY